MLVLSRKSGESIVIDGRIHLKIVRVEGDVVKLGIEAPPDVVVHRQEIYEEIQRGNPPALAGRKARMPRLPLPGSSLRLAIEALLGRANAMPHSALHGLQ